MSTIQQTEQQKQTEFVARKEFDNLMERLPKGLKFTFEMNVTMSRIGIQSLELWKIKGRSKTIIEDTPNLDVFVTALAITRKVLI